MPREDFSINRSYWLLVECNQWCAFSKGIRLIRWWKGPILTFHSVIGLPDWSISDFLTETRQLKIMKVTVWRLQPDASRLTSLLKFFCDLLSLTSLLESKSNRNDSEAVETQSTSPVSGFGWCNFVFLQWGEALSVHTFPDWIKSRWTSRNSAEANFNMNRCLMLQFNPSEP